jgi:two-component system LytT family sensor kinase
MTFIENLFKYGLSNHEHSNLLKTGGSDEGHTFFCTESSCLLSTGNDERTGIGITNTRKRLEHLYPGKHKLIVTREWNVYCELSLYELAI